MKHKLQKVENHLFFNDSFDKLEVLSVVKLSHLLK